jgi:hypothetical protein
MVNDLPQIVRERSDHERHEEMEVEFIGGPFDGTRLSLDVVRERPWCFRVLEMAYGGEREEDPLVNASTSGEKNLR